MLNDELKEYIQKLRLSKVSDNEITDKLTQAGWDINVVKQALSPTDVTLPPPPPPNVSNTNQTLKGSTNAWDAFEHILMFISLYVMATSIALILHYFVDKYFPGVNINSYDSYNSSWQDTMFRGYLAALIVSLPLFCFFFLNITKRTLANPTIRNLQERKTLTYFTLVVTFIIMLWCVIAAVYSFLNGNVTMNFILHILVTILVSGAVFGYYLNQVKEDRKQHA